MCLEQGADFLHMVQLMPLHPETPSSLASFKFRLFSPFWYRLTQVVLEKMPLMRCSSSCCSSLCRLCWLYGVCYVFALWLMKYEYMLYYLYWTY